MTDRFSLKTYAFFILALLAVMLLCVCIGSVSIAPKDTLTAVFCTLLGKEVPAGISKNIILNVRLPRVLNVALVGAALSLCGAAMQGLLRNPLADGSTLGVSSGASLGAVIGKFRTRNRNASLLTRFVNIETLAHQCMNQAGRWFYFGLCTIPGTNFVMHRHIIEEIGGWDPDALSEDTEISFRIYRMGYKIKLVPQAVTWEQEPFRLGIWFKQHTRWAMGNLYVLINNFKYIFDPSGGKMRMDVLYYALVYILMAFTLVCSDTMFVLGVLGYSHVSLGGLSTMVWVMACALFECNVMLTLAQEKNEFNLQSAALVLLMLFTYSKLWVVVVLRAMWMTVKKIVSKTDYTWYKTERSAD
mgnify:CR=1 FL=1